MRSVYKNILWSIAFSSSKTISSELACVHLSVIYVKWSDDINFTIHVLTCVWYHSYQGKACLFRHCLLPNHLKFFDSHLGTGQLAIGKAWEFQERSGLEPEPLGASARTHSCSEAAWRKQGRSCASSSRWHRQKVKAPKETGPKVLLHFHFGLGEHGNSSAIKTNFPARSDQLTTLYLPRWI